MKVIQTTVDSSKPSRLSSDTSRETVSVSKALGAMAIEHAVDNPNFLQQMADTLTILSHNLVAGDSFSSETFLQRLHSSGLGVEHQATFLKLLNDLRVQSESPNDWHRVLSYVANGLERPVSFGNLPFKSAVPGYENSFRSDRPFSAAADTSSFAAKIDSADRKGDYSNSAQLPKTLAQIQVAYVIEELTKWAQKSGLEYDIYRLPGYSLPAGFDAANPSSEHIAWMRRIESEINHQEHRDVQEVASADQHSEPSNYHEPMQARLAIEVREKIAALLRDAADLSKLDVFNHLNEIPDIERDLLAAEKADLFDEKMNQLSVSSHLVDLSKFAPIRPKLF